jgi:SH3-like domain-containing protein
MLVLAAAGLAACGARGLEGRDCPGGAKARSISGFCVPRYVSLKRGEVDARKGPGKDYPTVWVYHVRSLPVQIVAETTDWRRVCDPDGGAAWVHRSMIDGRRTVLVEGAQPLALRAKPDAAAPVAGLINARALASLDRCEGDWCKIKTSGVSGWAAGASLWGVAEAPQCR